MARPPNYRPEAEEKPLPPETVELKVHGVGGASPEELLGVPITERVAGDPAAGFFRPWLDQGRRPQLEGYSWGGLTSASRLRALWVLLSPFALANLAGWMVRHGGRAGERQRRSRNGLDAWTAALVRLLGLALTLAVVDYVAVAGIDLIAYQCGGSLGCTDGRWWMSALDNGLVAGHPGRILVVGAMVPLGTVLVLAWLTRRSQLAVHDRAGIDYSETSDPAFEVNLNHAEMWRSPHVAHRLGLVHTSVGLVATSITLASVADQVGVVSLGGLRVGLVATVVVTALTLIRLEGVSSRVHTALLGWSSLLAIATLVSVWNGDGGLFEIGPAPGSWTVGEALLPSYPVLILGLGVVSVWSWRQERTVELRMALMPVFLVLGSVAMVNAFGSGLMIRLADLLGTPLASGTFPPAEPMTQPPIVYSDAVSDVAVTTLVALVLFAAVGLWVWLRVGSGPTCNEIALRYADRGGLSCEDHDDRVWAAAAARAEATATLAESSPVVISVVVGTVLLGVVAAVVVGGDSDGMRLGPWADRLARPASVVLGLIPLAGILAISRLYQSRAVRRVVGIVWDVATFWPRWFHPWSPPGYGERAVPQLGTRLQVLRERGKVILSAHSQGSVLGLAALALADDRTCSDTAFLTYGSPLTRLYARYFPEYWSAELYATTSRRVSAWRNLWRRTDFIGGRILGGPQGPESSIEDIEVLDPISPVAPDRGEPRPRPLRHSAYERTPEYEQAVRDLT